MTKNMTRKGLAFGAGVALVASGLAGAPAQADTTGPITLVPNAGTQFNSIIYSGITLQSEIDPTITKDKAQTLTYLVENPGEKSVTATFAGSDKTDTGGSPVVGTYAKQITATQSTAASAASPLTKFANRISSSTTTDHLAADVETDKFIYISGAANDADGDIADENFATLNLGGIQTDGANTLALTVDTTVTTTDVTLYVTAWLDANGNGVIDTFEASSDREAVVLYAPGSVTATTAITYLNTEAPSYAATVVYGNDVNPHYTAAKTGVKLFKNGTIVDVSGAADDTSDDVATDVAGGAVKTTTVDDTGESTLGITKNTITAGVTSSGVANSFNYDGTNADADFGVGNYTAQAVYSTGSGADFTAANIVTVGSTSIVADLNAGSSADLVYVTPTHTTTEDTLYDVTDDSELRLRSGTKTVTFGAQIEDTSRDALGDSNVQVKAVVSEEALDATSTVTITGTTASLEADGSAITAFARTDSDGKVSFTLTSTTGLEDDAVDVAIYAKNSDGVWVLQSANSVDTTNGVDTGLDIVWEDATFTDLKVTPAAYVSGSNPTVSFEVVDQFSKTISKIDDLALSIYAVASFGGVADPATFSERVSMTDGTASFTFANFATAGSIAQLSATLYQGADQPVGNVVNVNVYNTAVTAEVTIADSFITNVTYKDYVTGDASTTVTAAAIAAKGIATTRDITGAVLTADGVGQPGMAVVVSAPGVLFNSGDTWAEDTITAYTNEYGSFTVGIATHVVNTTGATMTIEADGVSNSTKLFSYLPEDLDSNNLVFGWDLPSVLVKNTTYVLTGSLTDKWGNPVQTSGADGSVVFQGTGSVEVNGITTTVEKDFDKDGKAIVFIRSVKDIAGPGSVTATLQAIPAGYSIDPAVTPTGDGAVKGKDVFASVGNVLTDVVSTDWDETTYERVLSEVVDILDVAPAASGDQKVNAGSFKGYVALYAKGYEGQRMSAKVGNDWVVVAAIPAATNDLFRAVEFVGAGVEISVRIWIDRVLIETIPLLTK